MLLGFFLFIFVPLFITFIKIPLACPNYVSSTLPVKSTLSYKLLK